MSDQTPYYALERKKIEVQVGQLRQNKLAQELREMQLQHELSQIEANMAATDKAIAELEATADSLPTE